MSIINFLNYFYIEMSLYPFHSFIICVSWARQKINKIFILLKFYLSKKSENRQSLI